jgi:hypothetical protein
MSCDPPGHIYKMFFVYCAKCHNDEPLDFVRTYAEGRGLARRRGWSLTRAHGWVCPECKRLLRGERGAARNIVMDEESNNE